MNSIFYKSKVAIMVVSVALLTLFGAASLIIAKRQKGAMVRKSGSATIDIALARGKKNLIPLIVVGSGPAGLTAGIYGARGLGKLSKTLIIEGNEPGGLLTKTTKVDNWPGEYSILGPDLIDKIHAQAKAQGAEFLADAIDNIDTSSWPYKITTQEGVVLYAMSIVFATGATPKKLGIPGEQEYWGLGVSSCAICDAAFFKQKEVVVVGGGDSAVEQAFQLIPHVKSVKLLVRKEAMRAAQSMQDKLKAQPQIQVVYSVEPREIIGNGKFVTGIKIYNKQKKQEEVLPIDGVFLAIGHSPNTALLKGKVPLDQSGYVVMEGRTQHTLVEGIFAAGEAEDHRYKQAIVSAGQGAAAALDALAFLADIGYAPGFEHEQAVVKEEKTGKQEHSSNTRSKTAGIPEIISLQEFNELLETCKAPLLLDFYTQQCASCMKMLSTVEAVSREMEEMIAVFKVNAELVPELAQRFQVRKVPTFVLVSEDGKMCTSSHIDSKKTLVEFIEQSLIC